MMFRSALVLSSLFVLVAGCGPRGNEPVPAAHMVFMAKSRMLKPPPGSAWVSTSLASSPPPEMTTFRLTRLSP